MIEGHALGKANEVMSGVDNIYMAQGPREKLAYRKGFETGVGLIIEYWSKDKSKESALDVSVKVISMLEEKK